MNLKPLSWALALLSFATTGRAQNALYSEYQGQYHLVRRVDRGTPYIDDGTGKLVAASSTNFGLKDVKEYAPFYVSIRHLKVGTRALELVNSAAEINREFDFRGDFESPYPLRNVFVVLVLDTEDAGKSLFVREVGNLQPHELQEIDLRLPLGQRLGPGKYEIHVFTDGAEIFHSEMPFAAMEQKLDQMVRRRVEGVEDARPKPFIGPSPEYPAKLLHDKVSGTATIHFTINPNGRVIDPTIKTASLPEFGEAALVAARQWRFLPRMEKGRAVAMPADMPFTFVPPGAKPEKSK